MAEQSISRPASNLFSTYPAIIPKTDATGVHLVHQQNYGTNALGVHFCSWTKLHERSSFVGCLLCVAYVSKIIEKISEIKVQQ